MATTETGPVVPAGDYKSWSRADKERLVNEWVAAKKRSGTTQADFARSIGVAASAFGYWVSAYGTKKSVGKGRAVQEAAQTPERSRATDKVPTAGPAEKDAIIENLKRALEDERAKVASLQSVVLVLGYQLTE